MGIKESFSSKADFSGIFRANGLQAYIGDVLHKTLIEVDENGTKATAVTKDAMKNTAAIIETKTIVLDRPFAIIDNNTNLQIFVGVVYGTEF